MQEGTTMMAASSDKNDSGASKSSRGLGRGLSALIAENDYDVNEKPVAVPQEIEGSPVRVQLLAIKELQPGSFQPRSYFNPEDLKDLSESVRKNGVVQPVIVRTLKKIGGKQAYEIIAGERRWRAAEMAGLSQIPAIIMDLPDKQALEIALIENIQRQNLRPLEIATGYQRLIQDFDYTQEQLAEVIGKSRSQITNYLRLNALPEDVKKFLDEDRLSFGHARALIGSKYASEIAEKIVKRGLNVRQTEKMVQNFAPQTARKQRPRKAPIKQALQAIHRHAEEHAHAEILPPETGLADATGSSVEEDMSRDFPRPHVPVSDEFQRLRQELDGGVNLPTPVDSKRDPEIADLERVLSKNLGMAIQIHDQGEKGVVSIRYSTLEELDGILRRLERVAWLTPNQN